MDYEKQEELKELFEKYEDFDDTDESKNIVRPFKSEQICAVMFLYNKLIDKEENYFFHGEHDTLYIGSGLDIFEEIGRASCRERV